MSPLVLVGLLTISSLSQADVKHVLEGSAHPPGCTFDGDGHNHHHHHHEASSFTTSGNFNAGSNAAGSNGVPGSAAFWWMDANSPFKHAYDYYKKCSLKGNCLPPVAPGFQLPNNLPQNGCSGNGCTVSGTFEYKTQTSGSALKPEDIKNNVFLNGQVQGGTTACSGGPCKSQSVYFTQSTHGHGVAGAGTGGGVGCGGAGCTSPSGQAFFHTQGQGSGSAGNLNVAGNPFLNGGITSGGSKESSFTSSTSGHINVAGNPFLNGGVTQSAYSGNGQAVSTGSDGFLGVQPHVPFGKNDKAQPFPTAHPGSGQSSFSGEYTFQSGSASSGAQPFPTGHPGQSDKFQNCRQAGYLCVAVHQCNNGVISNPSQVVAQQASSAHYCEIGKEVCCRLPEGPQSGSTSSYSSFTSSSTKQTSGANHDGVVNLSQITAGKSSVPGATIKFGSGPGLSSGTIQVLDDGAPVVSTAGESGQGSLQHTSSPNSIKVARNTGSGNSENSIFSSTVDYSNDKLDQLSFVSTTQGPPYLPPFNSPKPPQIHTEDLHPPTISTYQPSIPTSRPVTKPVIPGVSVVSPYPTSSPKPFDILKPQEPSEQHLIPSYTPKPTASNQYLPPHTSSPTPFVTSPSQPPSYTTSRPTFPTFSTGSNVNNQYVPPKSPGSTPSPTYTTSKYVQPSQPSPGYSYPTPHPPFDYPKPSPTTPKPVVITESRYPSPSPTFTTSNYVSPSQPTPGYKYPTPSPTFGYPTTPKPFVTQSTNVNNQYVPPKQPVPSPSSPPFRVTPKPPSGGYSYPTPSPSFPTPTRVPTIPTRSPNEYLPPHRPDEVPSGGTFGGNQYVPPPTSRPPTRPPFIPTEGTGTNTFQTKLYAGCAAALKCVEESFCGLDGYISNSPVSLTRDQELSRAPTTQCVIQETGGPGKCCRDRNYVDPWPSANLINGQDDGQYREDDSLGQYFPMKQRPIRSGVSSNNQNQITGFGPNPTPSGFGKTGTFGGQYPSSSGFGGQSTLPGGPGKTGSFGGQYPSSSGFGGQSTLPGGPGKTGSFGGQNTASSGFGGESTLSGVGKTGSFGGQSTVSFGSGYNGQNTGAGGFGTGSGKYNSQTTVSGGFGTGADNYNTGAGSFGKTGGFEGQGGFSQTTVSGGFGGQNTGTGGFGGQSTGAGGFNGQSTLSGSFGKTSGFEGQGGFGGQGVGQGSGSGSFNTQGTISSNFGKTGGFGGQGVGGFNGRNSTSSSYESHSTYSTYGKRSYGQNSGNIDGSFTTGFGNGNNGFGGQGGVTGFTKTSSFQYSTGLAGAGSETCGIRHLNTEIRGPGDIEVGFAEIPWQAMVLSDQKRSLLCGGVIVKKNAVLTTATCIEGFPTHDILVKGGEWKLGVDEEPLPFQIAGAAAAIRHPKYQPGAFDFDFALLMLEENLRLANNIAPICLPPPNQAPVQPAQQTCVATGWGKKALKVHLKGAIMRAVDVNVLDSNQCSETLGNKFQNFLSRYTGNTICGYSDNDQCDVDHGSALACTNGNGQYSLAGVFSWDTGCSSDGQIGAYIQPDVEWIESTCAKPLDKLRAIDRQYNH